MIAALFVERDGAYFGIPGVDPWPLDRDATTYNGPHPVVAHPPCERWSQMNRVVAVRWGYVLGADGGTFASALRSLRAFGGVLEHPAESAAFPAYGIPRPRRGSWQDIGRGMFVTEVNQSTYGHPATKRTWLIASGIVPFDLDWSDVRGTHRIGGFGSFGNPEAKPEVPKAQRSRTPPRFRDVLIELASLAL